MSPTKPSDGQPLAADANVLRLPKPPPDFVPDSDWHPTWEQFAPSSGDKEHARQREKPVRVSVWDETLTSIAHARAFREGPTLVLRLGLQDVHDVAVKEQRPLPVVYEPLDPPKDARPGAAGHAGIEGLDRAPGQPKTAWRAMLQSLADRSTLVPE